MKEKSITNAGILKDYVLKVWAIYACEADTVHYLVKSSKKTTNAEWKTIDSLKDISNMIVFGNYKDANSVANLIIKENKYPEGVVNFQICEIIPSFESGGYWDASDFRGKIVNRKVK